MDRVQQSPWNHREARQSTRDLSALGASGPRWSAMPRSLEDEQAAPAEDTRLGALMRQLRRVFQ